MKIQKKVQQKYFTDVLEGRKSFEVRLADFRCKPGDTLVLLEQKQGTKKLTGRKLNCEVLYKLNTKAITKFYTKKDMDKHGLVILAIRRKYSH
jgi:ASC-1-like (ASCH) protein